MQGLSLQTLQRIVSVALPASLRPHLPELIATLIEGLSALEPQALSYMQFHAEAQYGVSGDQMEKLRLSAAKGGPLQVCAAACMNLFASHELHYAQLLPVIMLVIYHVTVGASCRCC